MLLFSVNCYRDGGYVNKSAPLKKENLDQF